LPHGPLYIQSGFMSISMKKTKSSVCRLWFGTFALLAILSSCGHAPMDAENAGQSSASASQWGNQGGSNNWNNGSGGADNNFVAPEIITEEPFVEDTTTVTSASQLPACNASNEGEALMVASENALYFCLEGNWYNNVVETVGVSCNNGELIAGATAEVVPVVPSTFGVDSTGNVVYRRSGIAMAGVAEKGPFRHGTSVKVVELDSTMRLEDSPRSHTTCITSSNGSYSFEPFDVVSPYVRVEASGYYRNELNGGLSADVVTLTAVTDLTERDSVNVNMLTHLEGPRTLKMVENTGNNQPIRMMKEQALKDILNSFSIVVPGFNEMNGQQNFGQQGGFGNFGQTAVATKATIADDISLFGDGDFSAALIAISVMMQRKGTGAEMLEYAGAIAERIKGNGNWDDFTAKADLADWLMVLDTSGAYNTIRQNLESLNQGVVPDFESYLRNFWTSTYQFPACEGAAVGTVTHIGNSLSSFFVSYYADPNGSRTRFICDASIGRWRTATDIEKDTVGLGADTSKYDGAIRPGVINKDKSYIYEKSTGLWRAATSDDIMEFSDVADVYKSLSAGESVVFILRHAERTNETGSKGHLTDNGKAQAKSVGAKFSGVGNIYFAYSGYTRTLETCENIASGAGQSASPEVLDGLDGEWYVKSGEPSIDDVSRWAYTGSPAESFYDLENRTNELVSKYVLANRSKLQKVNFYISHDRMVLPLAVYASKGKVDLRFFDTMGTRNWINFLAGAAVIFDGAGNVRYVPVRGLESGTMKL